MVELVVANQATIGVTPQNPIFSFIDALEERRLIPRQVFVPREHFSKIILGYVHHADFQSLVGLGIGDEKLQPTPSTFHLLEIRVVQDFVKLSTQLDVDRRDDRLD